MKSLLLICALGLSHADCTIDSATVVLQGPAGGGPAQCGFLAQAYLAGTSIAAYLDDAHYLKITLQPRVAAARRRREAPRPADRGTLAILPI
jgi:hypothetical protein